MYSLMLIAQVAEDFIGPLVISGLLDRIANGELTTISGTNVVFLLGLFAFLEIFGHMMWMIIVRIFWRAKSDIERDLTHTAFDHLQKMSFRFYADRFAGSLVNQVNKFVSAFDRLADALTWNVYKLIIAFTVTIIILGSRSMVLALMMVAIAVIFIPTVWIVRRRQIPFTTRWAAAETARTGVLADVISNITAVKSFSNEPLEKVRMGERLDDVYDRSIDTMKINMGQEMYTGLMNRSVNVSVVIVSVIFAINGTLDIGTIYLASTFTISLMRRLWDLNNTFRTFTRVFGDASDMVEILGIGPEVDDVEKPLKLKPADSSVVFSNVDFRYADDRAQDELFKGLNVEIKPGEKIGLVGPSGGGKTTITKLLMRFMDIQGGSIEIGGQDISQLKQSDLRKLISYVPQEPLLFHRTITENISYGSLDASDKKVKHAAKQAHVDEFVSELADGYDTLVGERGVKLSGGQKQRIAIARSVIKDAPILVLDEATSALDSESEKLIQDALWQLMEGRTALVIAHRLSTIQKMDRILVMDKGRIVEEGSHSQLVKKKNGVYAKLWSHQSGGFLND